MGWLWPWAGNSCRKRPPLGYLLLPPSHYLGYPNSQESLQQPGECPLLPYIWELSVEGVVKDDSPSSVVSIPFLLAQEWNGERGLCPCSSWG